AVEIEELVGDHPTVGRLGLRPGDVARRVPLIALGVLVEPADVGLRDAVVELERGREGGLDRTRFHQGSRGAVRAPPPEVDVSGATLCITLRLGGSRKRRRPGYGGGDTRDSGRRAGQPARGPTIRGCSRPRRDRSSTGRSAGSGA